MVPDTGAEPPIFAEFRAFTLPSIGSATLRPLRALRRRSGYCDLALVIAAGERQILRLTYC